MSSSSLLGELLLDLSFIAFCFFGFPDFKVSVVFLVFTINYSTCSNKFTVQPFFLSHYSFIITI